jgi:hypothetical protein
MSAFKQADRNKTVAMSGCMHPEGGHYEAAGGIPSRTAEPLR